MVTNLISEIQNDPEYLPYPHLRMKLIAMLSNVFMVKMDDQVMKELTANCGRVSRDLLIAKALSKRERKERPDIPAEELREVDQAGTQVVETHIGEFDANDEREWAIPGVKIETETSDEDLNDEEQQEQGASSATSSSSTKIWLTFEKRD